VRRLIFNAKKEFFSPKPLQTKITLRKDKINYLGSPNSIRTGLKNTRLEHKQNKK